MKRFLAGLATLAIIVVPGAASAQGLSIKGGLAFNDVSNNGALPGSTKQRNGFSAGLGISGDGFLSLGVEGLYAQRGLNSSVAGDARQLDYIDVPVYLRVGIPIPLVRPFAYAGPQASFEIKCSDGATDCTSSETGPKTTYSGVIGAGLHVPLAGLTVEGRYIYGLQNLDFSTVKSSASYKSRSFLILLGLPL